MVSDFPTPINPMDVPGRIFKIKLDMFFRRSPPESIDWLMLEKDQNIRQASSTFYHPLRTKGSLPFPCGLVANSTLHIVVPAESPCSSVHLRLQSHSPIQSTVTKALQLRVIDDQSSDFFIFA
mmetsp:Transcript_18831/g.27223  ORF Transcript_18831/g.27223 Transcript_18831/m.27223 type:complete len:123 (+) Transcript_18831:1304-1672(+)